MFTIYKTNTTAQCRGLPLGLDRVLFVGSSAHLTIAACMSVCLQYAMQSGTWTAVGKPWWHAWVLDQQLLMSSQPQSIKLSARHSCLALGPVQHCYDRHLPHSTWCASLCDWSLRLYAVQAFLSCLVRPDSSSTCTPTGCIKQVRQLRRALPLDVLEGCDFILNSLVT